MNKMNRIEKRFQNLKKTRKKALVAFITAGYPDLNTTKKLILEFSRIGVDIVELGIPFSDPMADGPIIQEASQKALEHGVTLAKVLKIVKEIRQHTQMPICFMTYFNPIFCLGEAEFVRQAHASGVDGVIIPDLPPDEGKAFIRLAHEHNLDVIGFISPTTTINRIKFISSRSRGFIYYISLTGVTGIRQALPRDIKQHLGVVRRITRKPVCVGFGISSRLQVKQIHQIADGAIVGSAIVKKIKENMGKRDLVGQVGRFVKSLKG